MKNKKIILISLAIILMIAVSGCTKKVIEKSQSNDNNQEESNDNEQISEEIINYLPNGKIDTSGWKTYRNEYYKMEIKHPLFLGTANKGDSGNFGFGLKTDWNYHYYFSEITYFDQMGLNSMEEMTGYAKDQYSDNPDFEEIKVDDGYVYYSIEKSKGGYYPGAMILGNNKSFWATNVIVSQTPEFKEYDPKYIEIFKASLKTIKFDN